MPCYSVRKDAWVPAVVAHGADWQGPPLGAEFLQPLQEAWARGEAAPPAGSLQARSQPEQVKGHTSGSPQGPEWRHGAEGRQGSSLGGEFYTCPPCRHTQPHLPSGTARPESGAAPVPLPFLPLPTDESPERPGTPPEPC